MGISVLAYAMVLLILSIGAGFVLEFRIFPPYIEQKQEALHQTHYKIKGDKSRHKILSRWWSVTEKDYCYYLEGKGCWPARSLEQ